MAGEDGTVDAVTDVVDTLVTDPAGIQASVTVIPASLQYALGRLQDNLMGFAPASGGDNPLQPLLDQLTGLGDMAGGGAGGDNPLQPLLDQLQGAGGDNPLQPLIDQFQNAGSGDMEGDNPLQPVLDMLTGAGEGGDAGDTPAAPFSFAFSFESDAFSVSYSFDGQQPEFSVPTP